MTDKPSVEAVVAQAGGPIDVLVYVAGGIRGQRPKPLEEVPVEDFHQIVDANLTGAFLFAQAVAPGMKRAGKGRIVTISSRAALAPSLTGIQAYASAKHGQLGLVRQLSHELGQFGITVNTVAPGLPAHQPGLRAAMGRLGPGGAEGVRRAHRHAPDGNPAGHCACCHVPRFGLCFLDHRPDPSRDGIADLSYAVAGATHDRTEAAGTLAVAGGALAQAGQSGARRARAAAEDLEERRALRLRDLVRQRPRDQRAARRRQVDRPHGLGPVRQPRRRAAHPARC